MGMIQTDAPLPRPKPLSHVDVTTRLLDATGRRLSEIRLLLKHDERLRDLFLEMGVRAKE